MQILLTGGTGVLGSQVAPRLQKFGYTVRIMSRQPAPQGLDPDTEWSQADVTTGTGLVEAVSNIDMVVHAASNPMRAKSVDVEGTGRLLTHAQAFGVQKFMYISIIGIERIPLGYYRHKLATEKLIAKSELNWSILRISQFHPLIDMFLHSLTRLPIVPLPGDVQLQTIDPGEAGDYVVQCINNDKIGRLPDLAGPEVWRLRDMVLPWQTACDMDKPIWDINIPGKISAGFRAGYTTAPERSYGKVTWMDWLARRYKE